VNWSLRNKTS